jgi:NADPH2:quinone reductase
MKAVLYERQGPAGEVLRVADVPRPDPAPGEVRVRLSLSGVNPTDWKSRSGATPRKLEEFQIPHHDGAGVIDAVGQGVDEARVGERVWVWGAAAGRRSGTAAQWTVVPDVQAAPLPDSATGELGASLGVPAMTAHRCLFADGDLRGKNVLVTGGAGAVGHFAIELARRAGARVATTVSGPEKAELARAAGADLVVNHQDPDALDRLRAFSPRMDRIVEVNIAANFTQDLALAGPETVVSVYAIDAPDPVLPVRACMTANVTLRFVLLYGIPRPVLEETAREVTAALREGALSALPVHRYPLEECAAAHEAVQGRAVGKVLLDIP